MSQLSLRRDLPGGDLARGVRQAASNRGATEPYSLRTLLSSAVATGVVWQGFHHRWEYNHRLNRLGSYVRRRGDGWVVGHTAASGSGGDTAHFEDRYTAVRAPGVRFRPGTVSIPVDGSEASRLPFSFGGEFTLDTPIGDGEAWTVVLNGFDIKAQADADKLIHFDVAVTDRRVSADGSSVAFTIDGSFEGACRTPECETFDDRADYEIDVHYLLVRGDDDALTIDGTDRVTNRYEWDVGGEDDEIHARNLGSKTATVDAAGRGAPRNTLAFESLSIDVERMERSGIGHPALVRAKAVHLLRWDTAVGPTNWDGREATADLDLFFKNWRQGMKAANIPKSEGALKDAGRVSFDVSLRLLRFDDTDVHAEESRSDRLHWGGGNADPNTSAARTESDVTID
jgi:hypothetical protein